MAVCEIWDVRGRLDHPIDYAENPEKTANPKYSRADLQAMGDVMKYATNGDKTERQFFVTGVNCDPATARDEMMIAKAQWNDQSEIVCYQGFQSFKAGKVCKYCYQNAMLINKKDLKPGDLIFYSYEDNGQFRNISHVAIYVGNGKMVHVANPERGVVLDSLRDGSVVFYARPYK